MNEREVIEKIKEVILDECKKAGVEVVKIILFGSRARGDAKPDSDFDVYVVVNGKYDAKRVVLLTDSIKWRLAYLRIPNDIVIGLSDDYEEYKDICGFLPYYVNNEGMSIWKR